MKKKLIILLAIFILCAGALFLFVSLNDDYTIVVDKDLVMIISRKSISQDEGGRSGEGMFTLYTVYRSSKNIKLSVICSDSNYLVFADLCNGEYPIKDKVLRLDYVPVIRYAGTRALTFEFFIKNDNYVIDKTVHIPGNI